MSTTDPLRSDPQLSEQLDLLSAQIVAEREEDIGAALAEMGIDSADRWDVPDVKPVDTQTYDDDYVPPPPAPVKRVRVDADGNRISHPRGSIDPGSMQMVGPVKPAEPVKPLTPAQIRRKEERKALFRVKNEQYLDRLHNAFIEQLGEEDELKRALALSDNPKAENFLKDLSDPRYNPKSGRKKWTVSALAHKNGLKPQDLAQIWRSYNLSKGSLVAISAIPRVMEDIAGDARSTQEVCPRCDGMRIIERRIKNPVEDPETGEKGEVEQVEWLDCPNCAGTGAIRKPGSSEARKIMTEMAGFTGKKGPLVQQTFVNVHNVESVVNDLEDLANAPVIDSHLVD